MRDDVIQPVDFALGHVEILFQFVGDLGVARGDAVTAILRRVLGTRPRSPLFNFFNSRSIELQMNVQRVERIADFMRDAGRQQRQRLDALAFDGLKGFLPRLGRVVQNQRHAGTAGRLAIERRGVEPEKARARIMHFKFVPRDARAARVVGAGNVLPIQFRQNVA